MDLTDELIYRACYMSEVDFKKKYPDQDYHKIRTYIVDEAIPIPDISVTPKTELIEELYDMGIQSPSLIAKEVGSTPGYVSKVLSKLRK